MNSLRKSLNGMVAFLFALAFMLGTQNAHAQTTLNDNGTLDTSSPTFRRPSGGNPPTSQGGSATSLYYYHTYAFDVTAATAGIWSFRSNSTAGGFDNFTFLYSTTFDPANPLTNILISNDDLSNSLGISSARYSGFDKNLTTGHYIFVTSHFYAIGGTSATTGAFANTLTSPPPPPTTKFNRPEVGRPPTALSATANNVPYVIERTVTISSAADAGYYRYVSSATGFDNFTVVYDGAFNPTTPLANAIAANDDFGSTTVSGFNNLLLQNGHTYRFVVTGKTNADFGNQTATLTLQSGLVINRPNAGTPPTTPSTTATAVPFKIFKKDGVNDTWTPTAAEAGTYKFTSTATDFDNFTILYDGPFDPNNALTNAVVANDDQGSTRISGFTYNFVAGHTYTFVVTGYSNTSFGTSTETLARVFQATLDGSVDAGSPTYVRPTTGTPPTSLSSSTVGYQVMTLVIPTAGSYEIVAGGSWDSFLSVYNGAFDSANPLTNILAANDDYSYGTYSSLSGGLTITLAAGTYTLVTAGYGTSDYGSYTMTVNGPAVATLTLVDDMSGFEVLNGTITYASTPIMGSHTYTFTFRPTGGGADIVAHALVSATTNGTATYSVRNNAVQPETSYQVLVSGGHVLKSLASVSIPFSGAASQNFRLLSGDINQDNGIDFGDLSALLQSYNALLGDPLYVAERDINDDEGIDFGDLSLMLQNYNVLGDEF